MEDIKNELEQIKVELENTKRAIWNMMIYSNKFVLILDEDMKVRFINLSLAKILGFNDEKEIVGMPWENFIPETERKTIKKVHKFIKEDESGQLFGEYINSVVAIDKQLVNIKWFNTRINHDYQWTFSFGVQLEKPQVIDEESVRSYYLDIIKKDRTTILAIRDKLLNDNEYISKLVS